MTESLRALLTGLIDYAGLFPPAQLPMDRSIENYVRYLKDADSWMLGRFICPAAKLVELAAFQKVIDQAPGPLRISALGRGGKDAESFLEGLRQDLGEIAGFREKLGEKVVVEVYEVRLPGELLVASRFIEAWSLFDMAIEEIEHKGATPLTPYFEVPLLGDEWFTAPILATTGIHGRRRTRSESQTKVSLPVGMKLRCGGLEVSAFPHPVQVAAVMSCCERSKVPLKCTAGLHHPIRHYNDGVKTKMHGFLNIFVAGVLANCNPIHPHQIREIIEDENPGNFIFENKGLHWKNFSASVSDIQTARRRAVISFGSCSFDEPREDLRGLGLL